MFVLVKIIIQYQIGCSYINKKCMCQQTFQRPSKYFWWLGTYLYNSIAYAVLQNMEIFTTAKFPFSRGQNCLSLFKSNWNSNFTKLSTAETKILTTSQTKNAQARRTSSFGIFTSPRPILLASGTGPPTNFEDCKTKTNAV
jgi:hypothetical protein